MKYKFIFGKSKYKGKLTYIKEMDSCGRTAEQMWHDACCLLDFDIFDSIAMFDENGKEYTEFY